MRFIFMPILFILFSQSIFSENTYFDRDPIGWHWNNVIEDKKRHQALEKENPIISMHKVQAQLEFFKDRALIDPSVANIRDYIAMQHWIMMQASLFSENWKKTILLYPEFNYNISHPTDASFSQLSQYRLHQNNIDKIIEMGKSFGLIFFYEGKNPLSQKMLETLSDFSIHYHFPILAVSVDDRKIKSGLRSEIDKGQAKRLALKAYPALVLANPKTTWRKIIAYGYFSQDELLSALGDK